ncbi:SusD/RagB family nutrient-binding outer membrane lipoprotein [Echinicola salinicaeni]|uniref:SusD/RagB family nutrient-binding outer membrane lipoprotein n=1 Tax=Echinicola salinicaeni TaxID=2762757 RepID=UPI001647277D|nr:SusD/RagB family nutrient-binding outer membrane lipoprotein [Echinicola salinicaeni]
MKLFHKTLIGLASLATLGSCTSEFEDINTNPNLIGEEDASAKYFLTELMVRPYIPARYAYWRANLIHTDRYAGHFTFGHSVSWWSDELGYSYNGAYTDAAWDHYNGQLSTLKQLIDFTKPGGAFENELTYSVVMILKSHYYQLFTDTFGQIPYSDLFKEGVTLPKFDSQKDIYKGIIADLDAAMATIGDNTTTGDALENLGDNDLIYGGDLQKWKRFANTLKLKMAMRALGADGDDFAQGAINEALAAPLLDEGESALIEKDLEISQWAYSTYGDVWYNFGGGSDWTVGRELVNYLRDNNDPRLDKYVKPSLGGEFTLNRPAADEDQEGYDLFPKRTAFIKSIFDEAGAEYTWDDQGDKILITMPEETNYIGQPVRLSGQMSSLAQFGFFARPSELVISQKNAGGEATPETIILSAESFFLQAEAIVKGMATGDATSMYQMGIKEAMRVWGVDDGSIDAFLSTESMAMLDGTKEENLEKIAIQRWIASYTDGYEAWAIVRDTGYPSSLAEGVSDYDIYGPGNITAGGYPQRLRYGSGLQTSNPDNYQAAVASQGPDLQETKLWWAK